MTLNRVVVTVGSPPHTWRIQELIGSCHSTVRITSTYVENTHGVQFSNLFVKDHLHIRGEYHTLQNHQHQKLGSPPHTWRILIEESMIKHPFRITSTYVENTKVPDCSPVKTEDHLHIRGEYVPLPELSSLLSGSPPHTWRILKHTR